MGRNTLGLQSNLSKLDAINKEKEEKEFFPISARVPTCPADRLNWHMVKIDGKSRCQLFEV
jgi:hypothetical protein